MTAHPLSERSAAFSTFILASAVSLLASYLKRLLAPLHVRERAVAGEHHVARVRLGQGPGVEPAEDEEQNDDEPAHEETGRGDIDPEARET